MRHDVSRMVRDNPATNSLTANMSRTKVRRPNIDRRLQRVQLVLLVFSAKRRLRWRKVIRLTPLYL